MAISALSKSKDVTKKVLVINPGGSSTKIGIFLVFLKHPDKQNCQVSKEFETVIRHPVKKLIKFKTIFDQLPYRQSLVEKVINNQQFDCIATRGGPLKPLKKGTYQITKKVIDDIKKGNVQSIHPSLLGPLISYAIAKQRKIPAYFVDAESVDEFFPLARFSGLAELPRKSLSHYLNIHAVVQKASEKLNRKLNECNFIVAHLGSGITIAAIRKGRQIDANNANEDGPFSPQRTGSLPLQGVIDICFSGKYSKQEMLAKIQRKGGLFSYLGTDDIKEIERRIKNGDKKANLVYNAMIYQIAKEIGAMLVALKGKVTAIIITGGIAHQKMLVNRLKNWIRFINKPIMVFAGEQEMSALAEGAGKVILKLKKAQQY